MVKPLTSWSLAASTGCGNITGNRVFDTLEVVHWPLSKRTLLPDGGISLFRHESRLRKYTYVKIKSVIISHTCNGFTSVICSKIEFTHFPIVAGEQCDDLPGMPYAKSAGFSHRWFGPIHHSTFCNTPATSHIFVSKLEWPLFTCSDHCDSSLGIMHRTTPPNKVICDAPSLSNPTKPL